MTKFLRKYQKQTLAVFTVLLMVMFAFNPNNSSSRNNKRRAIGHIGKEAVYADEKAQAAIDWQLLNGVYAGIPFLPSQFDPRRISPFPQPAKYVYVLGIPIVAEIDKNPELYLLLQREAQERGINVSTDQVETVLRNELYVRQGEDQFNHVTPETVGAENFDAVRLALARFLPVMTLVNRVGENVKVTEPITRRAIAAEQLVRLAIIDLPADRFQKSIPAPTPQQLQDQYEKFRDLIPPAARTPDNPLGFAYKLPDRVKVQYLTIPHDQLVKAVRASRSPYDWEVDERVYYYAHQDEYVGLPPPATAPATKPTTAQAAAATQPTSAQAAAATQPTTRPFAEVQEKVAAAVMADPIATLAQKIESAISARLLLDLKVARNATTTAPTTELASKAYLDSVALDIQKKFGVFPQVTQVGDWLGAQALAQLHGICDAFADDKSFVSLAMPDAQNAAPSSATLLEPSPTLKDGDGTFYIFRITQRDPAHAPPLSEVAAQVEADYRLGKAYAAATDAAKSLLESARKMGLSSAALAKNFPVITTTAFKPGSGEPIPQYPLSGESLAIAGAKAAELLSQATMDDPHPLAVAELPADKKAAVMQLTGVSSAEPPGEMYLRQFTRALMEGHMLSQSVAAGYFSYDAVKTRLNYSPVDTTGEKAGL